MAVRLSSYLETASGQHGRGKVTLMSPDRTSEEPFSHTTINMSSTDKSDIEERGVMSEKGKVSNRAYDGSQSMAAEHGAEIDADAKEKLEGAGIELTAADEHFDEAEMRATLRRIDLVLMPFMCLSVLLQYLDKTSLNYANLLNIKTDLHFDAHQYSWLGSIFYIGYLVASPVHGSFLQKLPLTRYLGVCIFLWGGTLALHAAAFNYAGLVVCRLFLGIFEASITPGFILLTGRFYKSKEQIARTSIWFSMNGWAQILGGAISYGVQVQRKTSLKVWQELYIILGVITLAYSFAVFFFMPERPETTRYLTMRMRKCAIERIRENKTGLHDKRWKWYQFREAIMDVRLYIVFLIIITTDIANGVTSNFSSAILSGLGFDSKRTALVGMSTGGSEVVALALGIAIAYATNTRWIPGVFSFVVAIAGGAMVLKSTDQVTQVAGYNLIFFFPVASALLYSWLSSAIGGTTKKIVFNVVLQLGYCAGNIIGPQTAGQGPHYRLGKSVMLAMFVVSAASMTAMSAVHYARNKSRDRQNAASSTAQEANEPTLSELADYTDKELRSFRYPY
jgi:predicted MFS family arabinose efflux permease